jgi:hypothetical protein
MQGPSLGGQGPTKRSRSTVTCLLSRVDKDPRNPNATITRLIHLSANGNLTVMRLRVVFQGPITLRIPRIELFKLAWVLADAAAGSKLHRCINSDVGVLLHSFVFSIVTCRDGLCCHHRSHRLGAPAFAASLGSLVRNAGFGWMSLRMGIPSVVHVTILKGKSVTVGSAIFWYSLRG